MSATVSGGDPIRVQRGMVLIYRLFDVADAIDIDRAATLVQRGETRRLDLRRFQKNQLSISKPPLSYELGQQRVAVDGQDFAVDSHVRIFDIGVLSIVLKVVIPRGATFDELVELNARISDHPAIERLAKDLAQQVSDDIKKVMLRPKFSGFFEDYTVTFIESFVETPSIPLLSAHPALPRLLLSDNSPRGISKEALEDATEMRFSYYADELAVIDYNSAFVYEPGGDPDIPDLIEFASAQLLELRYYDDLLDRELAAMYDEVERVRGKMRKREVRHLTRRLLQVVLEVTQLTEKIENSLKWVGDPYLAKFYQAAAKQFNLARWQTQVERKVNLISKMTELLSDQINTDRALLLESLVVILILFEIVAALIRH
ncbi:MAG: hypothetical protein IT381_22955 [Deltaproteobacteria bacterium]|nr:hypothetical protein [Deltaproteobacteria bacterium]